jgi:hypothetical protein
MSWQNKPIEKKKITSIDAKYLPPKQRDAQGNEIPFADDPKTIAWIAEYAANAQRAEQEAKLEAKRHEEELKQMEEREKKQREEQRERLKHLPKPKAQFDRLVSGERYTCHNCNARLKYFALCTNPHCQAPRKVDIEPGMAYLKQEIFELNLKLKKQNNKNKKRKQQITPPES